MVKEKLEGAVKAWDLVGYPAIQYRFVLRNGQFFQGERLPKGYERGFPKQCFFNAFDLVHSEEGLSYYEGYCIHPSIKLEFLHAWCVREADGKVIDITLDKPEEYTYFGVKFDKALLHEEVHCQGHYGLLGLEFTNTALMYRLDPELEELVHGLMKKYRRDKTIDNTNNL